MLKASEIVYMPSQCESVFEVPFSGSEREECDW